MFRSHIFVSICLLLIALCSPAQAEIIHVQWGEALPLTTLKQAENTTLRNIINTKAQQYIGRPLSAKRQMAFEKYLATQARAFVSSISVLETTPYPDGTNNTIFAIQINTPALHQLIRELGVIYTARAEIPYTLILQKPETIEKQKISDIEKIAELELITGLIRKPNMPMQLELSYKAPLWHATITPEPIATPIPKPITTRLKPISPQTSSPEQMATADQVPTAGQFGTQNQTMTQNQAMSPEIPAPVAPTLMLSPITAEAPSLDSVWRSVWGSYLSKQQQIAAQTAEIYSLRVWGWKNSSAIEQLHQKLQTWEASLQNPVLATIDMQSGTTAATWQLHVMHHDDLLQRLKKYTDQHGVSFTLDTLSAAGTQYGTQYGSQTAAPSETIPLPISTPLSPEPAPVSVQAAPTSAPTNEVNMPQNAEPQTPSTALPAVSPQREADEMPNALPTETPRKWYEAPLPKK